MLNKFSVKHFFVGKPIYLQINTHIVKIRLQLKPFIN